MLVQTGQGPGRMLVDPAAEPVALLLLGHGAGGGPQALDLVTLARWLPAVGVTVVRFEQPWRLAGRKVAGPPSRLDEAWLAAVDQLVDHPWARLPLWLGGRSAGARVACRTADRLGARGVVALAFPLHPPGRPDRSRAGELLGVTAPRLVLQGSRDGFGSAVDVARVAVDDPGVCVVELLGADHSFRLPAAAPLRPAELRRRLVEEVSRFVLRAGAVGIG